MPAPRDLGASFPSTSRSSTTCEDDTDTAITVSWAYTDAIYPNADDKLVVRQCGYLNAGLMLCANQPTQYTDAAGTDDVDYASSSVTCMIGLRFTGAPLDITPSMGSGTSGFSGVVFSWLDTSYEEAQFNVYRRSQGTPASANSHVADVLNFEAKCGATVAPLTFTDGNTGYTPGVRVDADLASVTGSVDYTVPWIGDFKVAAVPNSNPNGAVEGVYVSIAHMLTSSEPDPLYDPMVWGRTDADGVLSVVVRVVDYEWSDTTQYFNATPSLVEDGVSHVFSPAWQVAKATHIYGGSARFTDETTVLIQGYARAGGATTPERPATSARTGPPAATTSCRAGSRRRPPAAATARCPGPDHQHGPGDFVPCRVPIPYFDGQNARLPCSSWSSSTEARWTRVDEFFSGNGLGAYDSVDLSNGDDALRFNYSSPLCLEAALLLPSPALSDITDPDASTARDPGAQPYNNAAENDLGPAYNELLLLAAPEATESDDNAYGGPTCPPARGPWGYEAYGGSCGLAFSYDAPTYDATTPGADHAIDVSVQDRVSGFTTTETYGYDGALDYGFQYAVAPNALNPSRRTAVLNFDRDLIDAYAYAGLVVDSVARAKRNCESGTIFAGSDDTTRPLDDMLDDLAITRDADDLPSWTLDTLGAMNRHNVRVRRETEISYTIEQGSGMSQDVDLTTDADGTIAADFTTEFTIFGAKVHAGLGLDQSASVTVNIGRGAERSHDRDHSVTITLADDDPGDVFVVKIEADPTFGTPVFTTAGGESVCPGETPTSRRAESITIFDVLDQCTSDYGSGLSAQGGGSTACDATNLVYGDAYFSVIAQNEVDLESVTAEPYARLGFRASRRPGRRPRPAAPAPAPAARRRAPAKLSPAVSRGGASPPEDLTLRQHAIAGALARAVAQSAVHPLNACKTVLQGSDGAARSRPRPRAAVPAHVARAVAGLGAQALLSLPNGALNFCAMEAPRAIDAAAVRPRRHALVDAASAGVGTVVGTFVSLPQSILGDRIMAAPTRPRRAPGGR
ncbi:glutathione transferase [Aureococcus anophagefferens]|nr:glutathione transferase [Aureococcus anophagefferens]